MVDSISRNDLLKEYNETRTSIRSDEKELLQHSLTYLTSRAAEKRFPKLGCLDLYRELRKLVSNSDIPHGDAILKIKAGFSHLEQYALNLLRSPWRKEFHVIKTYTGFFKCKVQRSLPDATTAWLITCLGYKQDDESGDHFLLKEPIDVQKIQQVSLYLFLVTVELQIIHEIASFAEPEGYSLKQVIRARFKTVKGANEAIYWLQNESNDESIKKKLKLDRDNGVKEPEGVGQLANQPSVNSTGERTLSGHGQSEQQQNEEASKSRPKGSDRETKFPPSFSASSFPSDGASTRDISTAHYPYTSAFDSCYPGASASYIDPGAVGIGESHVEQLTDCQLYGFDDHSAEHHLPASNEDIEITHLSYPNGLLADEHNTTVSQELPLRNKEEKLYVNLPEKTSAYCATSTADVGSYQNVPAPVLSPGIPPPDYLSQDDYVMIDRVSIEGEPAETMSMRTMGISGKRKDVCDSQFYQKEETRQLDLSSVNTSMSETLVLDRKLTYRATVYTGSSGNADVYIKGKAILYEPESGLTVLETERQVRSQRSAFSFTEVKGSAPDRLATRSCTEEDKGRHHEVGKQLPEGFKDVQQDKLRAEFQTSAEKRSSSDRSCELARDAQTPIRSSDRSPCDFCSSKIAELICIHCYKMVCEDCQVLFDTDMCNKTMGRHSFLNLRDAGKGSKKTSAQRPPAGAPAGSPMPWNCVSCTYVNPAESSVCAMCAKTRGMSKPELPKPGTPVCRECTYWNKEGSEVCEVCNKSLRRREAETIV